MSQKRSQKSTRRRRRQQRSGTDHLHLVGSARGWRAPPPSSTLPDELDGPGSLPDSVRQAAAEPSPIPLLELASTMVSSADPRVRRRPLEQEQEGPDLAGLVDALLAPDAWETSCCAG